MGHDPRQPLARLALLSIATLLPSALPAEAQVLSQPELDARLILTVKSTDDLGSLSERAEALGAQVLFSQVRKLQMVIHLSRRHLEVIREAPEVRRAWFDLCPPDDLDCTSPLSALASVPRGLDRDQLAQLGVEVDFAEGGFMALRVPYNRLYEVAALATSFEVEVPGLIPTHPLNYRPLKDLYLHLSEGRRVIVSLKLEERQVPARFVTDIGGFFFFENSDNPEVLVKVLNGCAINGHRWVFASAASDQDLTLEASDWGTSSRRSYQSPAGEPLWITDTRAFPCSENDEPTASLRTGIRTSRPPQRVHKLGSQENDARVGVTLAPGASRDGIKRLLRALYGEVIFENPASNRLLARISRSRIELLREAPAVVEAWVDPYCFDLLCTSPVRGIAVAHSNLQGTDFERAGATIVSSSGSVFVLEVPQSRIPAIVALGASFDVVPPGLAPDATSTLRDDRLYLGRERRFLVSAPRMRSRYLGPDGGYLFFTNPRNPEVLVKVLDGCRTNGYRWVFASAATDLAVELDVLDRQTGEHAIYRTEGNEPLWVTDTEAFPCD